MDPEVGTKFWVNLRSESGQGDGMLVLGNQEWQNAIMLFINFPKDKQTPRKYVVR